MATQNRLSRIDARISFFHQGREIWKSTPTARTTVPLPRLPSFTSTRLALSNARLPGVEKTFYDDAHAKIGEKFRAALGAIPDCPRPRPPRPAVVRDP
jgi:hypothetical protein